MFKNYSNIFNFIIVLCICIIIYLGVDYYFNRRPFNALSEALGSGNLSNQEFEEAKSVCRNICKKNPKHYIKYYRHQKKIKKTKPLFTYYRIRNFFGVCPLSIIKNHSDIFLNDPDEIFHVLYGFTRQKDLPCYFTDEELIKYAKKSKDKVINVLLEAILYRYYGYDQYETKLKNIFEEFIENGLIDPYDEIQYPLLKVLYEKNVYNRDDIQKMVDDGLDYYSDTRIFMEKLGIKGLRK